MNNKTNDVELNNLLEDFDKLKSGNINLVSDLNTRKIFDSKLPESIKMKSRDIDIDDSLNRVNENQISGIFYRADIGDNRVEVSKKLSNYDIQNTQIESNNNTNQMIDFTKNSYGVASIRGDTNIATLVKRDDYLRNRPTGNLFSEGQKKVLFSEKNSNLPFHKEFFNNIKNNVTQNNNIDYEENISNKSYYLKQNEFNNITPLYPNININEPVNEHITEHTLIIDSMDRNFSKDENLFNFRVAFKPPGPSVIPAKYDPYTGALVTPAVTLPGATGAYFSNNLERVRYLRLDKLLLPNRYKIETATQIGTGAGELNLTDTPPLANPTPPAIGALFGTSNEYRVVSRDVGTTRYNFVDTNTGCYYHVSWDAGNKYWYLDDKTAIKDDRFTLLEISEITSPNEYSTNTPTQKSFGVLYPEKIHNNSVLVNTTYSGIVYKFSNLKNINSLSFKFSDSIGTQLDSTNNYDTSVSLTSKTSTGDVDSPDTYILHPLFRFSQIHMVFKVGVVELEHNMKKVV